MLSFRPQGEILYFSAYYLMKISHIVRNDKLMRLFTIATFDAIVKSQIYKNSV